MKKLFTVAAVALMTVASAAQSTETLYGAIESIPWDCEITGAGAENICVSISGGGSHFNIASEEVTIDLTKYKACRIEYGKVTSDIEIIISQDEVTQEVSVSEDANATTVTFSDEVKALGTLTSLYLGTSMLNQTIEFKKAVLILNDDNEEVMTTIGGAGTGANIAVAQPEMKFTGANGRMQIVNSSRKSINIDPEYDEKAYIYTIELAEPTTETLTVSCDGFLGDIVWSKDYPAGTTTITFDPAEAFPTGYSNYIYIKALDENATYPFTVKVKSMYRTEKSDTDGINSIKADSVNNDAVYTIGGQRATSNAKGLLIKNNRKFVKL